MQGDVVKPTMTLIVRNNGEVWQRDYAEIVFQSPTYSCWKEGHYNLSKPDYVYCMKGGDECILLEEWK